MTNGFFHVKCFYKLLTWALKASVIIPENNMKTFLEKA